MPPPSPTKVVALAISVVFFLTNAGFSHMAEGRFWEERRTGRRPRPAAVPDTRFASLSSVQRPITALQPALTISPHFEQRIGGLPPGLQQEARLAWPTLNRFGMVKSLTFPAGRPARRLVIHIQDVHRNSEAQENISSAVRNLLDQGAGMLVALEGAFGPIDLKFVQSFPDTAAVRETADFLLSDHRISGPVHAALHSIRAAPLVGVDDRSHYNANVEAYRRAAERSSEQKKAWAEALNECEREKRRVFQPELMALDRVVQKHWRGELPLGEYATFLVHRATLVNAEQALLFVRALEMEQSLNRPRIEAERSALLSALIQKLTPHRTNDLMNWSLSYRMGAITSVDFYERVRTLAAESGVRIETHTAFDAYMRYLTLADQIQTGAVLQDLSLLEQTCFNDGAKSPEEKRLVARSRQLALTEKLLNFSLTREEWKEYKQVRYADFALEPFESFYRFAEARDKAMSANLGRVMNERDLPVAVLVTGGFHAEGIETELHKAGAAVMTYVPRITKVDLAHASAYLSAFSQEKTPLEKLFQGEKLFLAHSPADHLSLLAGSRGTSALRSQKVTYEENTHLNGLPSRVQATTRNGRARVQVRSGNRTESVQVVRRGGRLQEISRTMSSDSGLRRWGRKSLLPRVARATAAASLLVMMTLGADARTPAQLQAGFIGAFVVLAIIVGATILGILSDSGGHSIEGSREKFKEESEDAYQVLSIKDNEKLLASVSNKGIPRFYFDRLNRSISFNGVPAAMSVVQTSISDLLAEFQRAHPRMEVLGEPFVNSNLGPNDGTVCCTGDLVYANAKEFEAVRQGETVLFSSRKSHWVVIQWADGRRSLEEIEFKNLIQYPDAENAYAYTGGEIHVRAREGLQSGHFVRLVEPFLSIYSGQPLIVGHNEVPLHELANEVADIHHLLRLPRIGNTNVYLGTAELIRDRAKLISALQGNVIGLSLDEIGENINADDVFKEFGYSPVGDATLITQPGQYALGDGFVSIKLLPGLYPLSLIAFRDGGETDVILIPGESRFVGGSLATVQSRLKRRGYKDVLLFAEGKDVADRPENRNANSTSVLVRVRDSAVLTSQSTIDRWKHRFSRQTIRNWIAPVDEVLDFYDLSPFLGDHPGLTEEEARDNSLSLTEGVRLIAIRASLRKEAAWQIRVAMIVSSIIIALLMALVTLTVWPHFLPPALDGPAMKLLAAALCTIALPLVSWYSGYALSKSRKIHNPHVRTAVRSVLWILLFIPFAPAAVGSIGWHMVWNRRNPDAALTRDANEAAQSPVPIGEIGDGDAAEEYERRKVAIDALLRDAAALHRAGTSLSADDIGSMLGPVHSEGLAHLDADGVGLRNPTDVQPAASLEQRLSTPSNQLGNASVQEIDSHREVLINMALQETPADQSEKLRPLLRRVAELSERPDSDQAARKELLDLTRKIIEIRQAHGDLLEHPFEKVYREPADQDSGVDEYLRGKRVFITGGAGAVGTILCGMVLEHAPARIVVIDNNEESLGRSIRNLTEAAQQQGLSTEIVGAHVDTRDTVRLRQVFQEHRPEVVFHLAAQREVGKGQVNVLDTVLTNIEGTKNVVQLAEKFNSRRCVHCSTAKCRLYIDDGVYAQSKILAEGYLQIVAGSGVRLSASRMHMAAENSIAAAMFVEQAQNNGVVTLFLPSPVSRPTRNLRQMAVTQLNAGLYGRRGEVFGIARVAPRISMFDLALWGIIQSGRSDAVLKFVQPKEGFLKEGFPGTTGWSPNVELTQFNLLETWGQPISVLGSMAAYAPSHLDMDACRRLVESILDKADDPGVTDAEMKAFMKDAIRRYAENRYGNASTALVAESFVRGAHPGLADAHLSYLPYHREIIGILLHTLGQRTDLAELPAHTRSRLSRGVEFVESQLGADGLVTPEMMRDISHVRNALASPAVPASADDDQPGRSEDPEDWEMALRRSYRRARTPAYRESVAVDVGLRLAPRYESGRVLRMVANANAFFETRSIPNGLDVLLHKVRAFVRDDTGFADAAARHVEALARDRINVYGATRGDYLRLREIGHFRGRPVLQRARDEGYAVASVQMASLRDVERALAETERVLSGGYPVKVMYRGEHVPFDVPPLDATDWREMAAQARMRAEFFYAVDREKARLGFGPNDSVEVTLVSRLNNGLIHFFDRPDVQSALSNAGIRVRWVGTNIRITGPNAGDVEIISAPGIRLGNVTFPDEPLPYLGTRAEYGLLDRPLWPGGVLAGELVWARGIYGTAVDDYSRAEPEKVEAFVVSQQKASAAELSETMTFPRPMADIVTRAIAKRLFGWDGPAHESKIRLLAPFSQEILTSSIPVLHLFLHPNLKRDWLSLSFAHAFILAATWLPLYLLGISETSLVMGLIGNVTSHFSTNLASVLWGDIGVKTKTETSDRADDHAPDALENLTPVERLLRERPLMLGVGDLLGRGPSIVFVDRSMEGHVGKFANRAFGALNTVFVAQTDRIEEKVRNVIGNRGPVIIQGRVGSGGTWDVVQLEKEMKKTHPDLWQRLSESSSVTVWLARSGPALDLAALRRGGRPSIFLHPNTVVAFLSETAELLGAYASRLVEAAFTSARATGQSS